MAPAPPLRASPVPITVYHTLYPYVPPNERILAENRPSVVCFLQHTVYDVPKVALILQVPPSRDKTRDLVAAGGHPERPDRLEPSKICSTPPPNVEQA